MSATPGLSYVEISPDFALHIMGRMQSTRRPRASVVSEDALPAEAKFSHFEINDGVIRLWFSGGESRQYVPIFEEGAR